MASLYCLNLCRALGLLARFALAFALLLAFAPASAAAKTLAVCPTCTYKTIQAALNAAQDGDTISVSPDPYKENLLILHQVTLAGAGQSKTFILPAVSNPNCGGQGGSLCPHASNIILVNADNVTIHDLTLDGDNPALLGIPIGNADVDARNGIITNHLTGTYTNLSVHDVTVKNVYSRGIYASSGGTFAFDHNTVRNVQGDSASAAIQNFNGAGSMTNNLVSEAYDGLAATQSHGTQFLNNIVLAAFTGIHTDEPGKNTGAADLIQNNQISGCTINGQGVRVLMPYIAPLVRQNTVTGCDVGLAAHGHGTSVAASFSANAVDGAGRLDSMGIRISTDQLGLSPASGNVAVALSNNSFTNVSTTLDLQAQPSFTLTITATENAFGLNATKGIDKFGSGTYTLGMARNWWGSPTGPTAPDNAGGTGTPIPAGVGFSPWLCAGADTSAAIGYQPDPAALCNATPPDTQITEQPADPNTSKLIRFGFAGSDDVTPAAGLSFECKTDAGPFEACASPKSYTTLGVGPHTFAVRAKDPAGHLDATPAVYTWTQAVPPLRFVYLPLLRR
jgi:hypothetical protein